MKFNINKHIYGSDENRGLTLYHFKVSSDDISVIASVNAGPLYEDDRIVGISHWIEHVMFKGSRNNVTRNSRDAIYNEMSLLGGQNFCYTDSMNVPLGMRVIVNDFESSLDLISDIYLGAKLDPEEVMKEREIVIDEIRNRNDTPYTNLWDSFDATLFCGSAFGRPGIGTIDNVSALVYEDLAEFYQKVFFPGNMDVFVVGPKSFNEVKDLVGTYFRCDDNASRLGKKVQMNDLILPSNKQRLKTISKDLENIHWMMGRILPTGFKQDKSALEILSKTLSRAVSQKILNENPISYNRWTHFSKMLNAGVLMAYAAFDPQNFERVRELVKTEFEKFRTGTIPEEHIKDKIIATKKALELGGATTMDKAKIMMRFQLEGDLDNLNTRLKDYDKLSIDDVKNAAAKYICLEDLTEVALGHLSK